MYFNVLTLFSLVDLCRFGMNDQFTVVFYNSLSFPIDIFWIDLQEKEQKILSNLSPGLEGSATTYFKHKWIFKLSGTDTRLYASANGMEEMFFEGCHFEAQKNSQLRVDVFSKGTVPQLKLNNYKINC